jgi:hypothetical protein
MAAHQAPISEPKPFKTFQSTLPLVNTETLFSAGVWVETFNFIGDYLPAAMQVPKISEKMTLTVRDLYFSKACDTFDFNRAQRALEEFCPVKTSVHEPNDRGYETGLRFQVPVCICNCYPKGVSPHLYEYKGLICFNFGPFQHLEGEGVKRGHFQWDPLEWRTDIQTFMKFVSAVERSLLGPGYPDQCRAFFAIGLERASIEVEAFFHPLLHESKARIDGTLAQAMRKVMKPRFEIKFYD